MSNVLHRALHCQGKRFDVKFLTHGRLLCKHRGRIRTEIGMRKRQTLSLRVSADFKRRLVEEAKKEKRSVTNYIEATLTALWQRKDSEIRPRSKENKVAGHPEKGGRE